MLYSATVLSKMQYTTVIFTQALFFCIDFKLGRVPKY